MTLRLLAIAILAVFSVPAQDGGDPENEEEDSCTPTIGALGSLS